MRHTRIIVTHYGGPDAIGAGLNLSSYFTVDKDGNLRPSTAAWDIGAYEYVNTVLSAPTNLRLTN